LGAFKEQPKRVEDKPLQRLFLTFPGRWPGIALLLLRAVTGTAVLLQGEIYITGPDPTPATWFVGLAACAAGFLLVIGFLTPVVGVVVVAISGFGVALSLLPASPSGLFDTRPSLIFGLTMLVTVIGLGPGAYSIDARIFGRREIIIPPPISRSNG